MAVALARGRVDAADRERPLEHRSRGLGTRNTTLNRSAIVPQLPRPRVSGFLLIGQLNVFARVHQLMQTGKQPNSFVMHQLIHSENDHKNLPEKRLRQSMQSFWSPTTRAAEVVGISTTTEPIEPY
jgi:hypothetical protein